MLFSLPHKFSRTATVVAIIFLTAAVFVYFAPQVLAQASLGLELPQATGLGTVDLKTLIVKIIRILLGFLGIVAVLIVMYGGYLYLTSEGSEEKISQAKKILLNGGIGLAIILSAFLIVSYVLRTFEEALQERLEQERQLALDFNIGALGGGVLENVYPEPGAVEVPRNTLIMVSFKEPMSVDTLINQEEQAGCPEGFANQGLLCGQAAQSEDPLTEQFIPNIKIINRNDNNRVIAAADLIIMTADRKNFVINPYGDSRDLHLGSTNGNTDYAVNLTDQIDKGNGGPAFLAGGYTWFFQVSNVLDETPPQVVAVVPVPGEEVYQNAVVQIDFNEAVNVAAATGRSIVNENGQLQDNSFQNITLSHDNNQRYVNGEFIISNQFRTVTFVSDQACLDEAGQPIINSCGEMPKCLPGDASFLATIKAAPINPFNALLGISDAAGNSLDGGGENGQNANGQSNGQPDDNYWWNFSTNNQMYLEPPQIVEPLEPERDALNRPINQRIKALFNARLLSSSLNTDNVAVFKSVCGDPEMPTEQSCYPPGGFAVYKESAQTGDRAVIRTYPPYLEGLTSYSSRLTSKIKDIYQNCFYPACGPGECE